MHIPGKIRTVFTVVSSKPKGEHVVHSLDQEQSKKGEDYKKINHTVLNPHTTCLSSGSGRPDEHHAVRSLDSHLEHTLPFHSRIKTIEDVLVVRGSQLWHVRNRKGGPGGGAFLVVGRLALGQAEIERRGSLAWEVKRRLHVERTVRNTRK